MDPFDFKDENATGKGSILASGKFSDVIWRLGAIYFICMSVLLLCFFAYTFINPNNPYNPFPPDGGEEEVADTETPISPTETVIETESPTATFTITIAPTATIEILPTATLSLLPSQTAVDIDPSTATPEEIEETLYEVLSGDPTYLAHPDGCDGLFVAGNVTDIDGDPVIFMMVRIQGILAGEALGIEDVFSGTAPEYGESGWELQLTETPVASTGSVYIQLFDPDTEEPVSTITPFNTYDDCARNLIMINFEQVQ